MKRGNAGGHPDLKPNLHLRVLSILSGGDMQGNSNPVIIYKSEREKEEKRKRETVCLNVFDANGLVLPAITLILFRQRYSNQQNGRIN